MYPNLYREKIWKHITMQFARTDAPDEALVSNVTIVPFVGERIVVLTLDNGLTELPGGTLEPGENYREAIRRELIEEAGAEMRDFTPFGEWRCHSTHPTPYRPHLPHPEFIRVCGYGTVEVTGEPTNPDEGETVVRVEAVMLDEAMRRFNAIDRPEIAELCLLAAHIAGVPVSR